MKKYSFILAGFILFSCQSFKQETGFTINGKIEGLEAKEIIMAYHDAQDIEHRDTVATVNGTFQFTGVVGDEAQFAMIYSSEARFQKVFYLENANLTLTGSSDKLDKLVISGSPVQDDFNKLEDEIMANRQVVMGEYEKVNQAQQAGDTATMQIHQAIADSLYRYEWVIRKNYVLNNPKSFVSLNELLNWANDANFVEAKTIFDGLDASIKGTKKAQEVAERLANLERVQVGKPVIDFAQNDVNGNAISTANYKGKYVLLEFWASWCGPCRAENPNLRNNYLAYHDKGLEILGISLDDNGEKWKKAMEQDQLPWKQVSDLQGWKNVAAVQYGVRAIPANFLISPDGTIVARDLRGEKLNEKLVELFGAAE